MSFQDKLQLSGVVSFTGVTVVFVVLILLIVIISLFSRIISRTGRGKTEDGSVSDADYQDDDGYGESVIETVDAEAGETDQDTPSTELVAAIMAALTAFMGEGASFRLRSIRRTHANAPAWNVSGRQEYLQTRL